jgi:hypothetical protein
VTGRKLQMTTPGSRPLLRTPHSRIPRLREAQSPLRVTLVSVLGRRMTTGTIWVMSHKDPMPPV